MMPIPIVILILVAACGAIIYGLPIGLWAYDRASKALRRLVRSLRIDSLWDKMGNATQAWYDYWLKDVDID